MKRITPIILCICIVICFCITVFIKEGKRIASTPRNEDSNIYISEDTISFKSLNPSKSLFYTYNITDKQLTKTRSQPDYPTNNGNLSKVNDYYLTEQYKFTRHEEYLLKTDLLTDEEQPVILYATENKFYRKYHSHSYKIIGNTIYFIAVLNEKSYLCKCDKNGYCTIIEPAISFKSNNGNVYYINEETTEQKLSKSGEVIKEKTNKRLMVYDGENTSRELIDFEDDTYDNFYVSENSIAIIGYKAEGIVFQVYSLNGEFKNNLLVPINSCFEKENHLYGCKKDSKGNQNLVKIAKDYLSYEVICDNLIDSRFDFIKSAHATSFIFKETDVYYFVKSDYAGEDSFAFCKLDKNGNIEIIAKERRHFLRNFFKMQLL